MSLCLRYENIKGDVVECFNGIVHVKGTTALTLKKAILSLLADHSLSPFKIPKQGYDRANNMIGEINCLNTLIGDVSSNSDDQLKVETACYALESFGFVFLVILMKKLFGVENDLNYALQEKDQDIVEAMSLIELTKERLQIIRNDGWEDGNTLKIWHQKGLKDVGEFFLKLVELKKHTTFDLVHLLIKLALILPEFRWQRQV
uniref:DUF4371 domain-containing protein n=1 Tax=Tanacetum cinerariifolium TaxID=118510 RepID=A0A6L2KIJ2_TANCI|nr:hypothetical protein [Tanacetum cinerariifolium]